MKIEGIEGIRILPIRESDRPWISSFLTDQWDSNVVVSRGRIYQADLFPGFLAIIKDEPRGIITYIIEDRECQIITLNSTIKGKGIGTRLIQVVINIAQDLSCKRVWVITTNDNTQAIRFYQKRGFRMIALHRDAIFQSRKLKPSIPLYGYHGIPIRDEIEFELRLE